MKGSLCWMLVFFGCTAVVEATAIEGKGTAPNSTIVEARQRAAAGDKEGAALLYYQALQLDKANETARHELATLLVASQIAAPFAEQSDVMAILEGSFIDPAFPSAYFPLTFLDNGALTAQDETMNRGVLLVLQKLQKNENGAALRIAEKLQQEYPNHPVPYNLLGLAWQGQGDPSKAREFFERALALKEDFHAARINLAELELHLGDFLAAHQALDTVLKKDRYNRRACLLKAHLSTVEGKTQLANLWYSRISEAL